MAWRATVTSVVDDVASTPRYTVWYITWRAISTFARLHLELGGEADGVVVVAPRIADHGGAPLAPRRRAHCKGLVDNARHLIRRKVNGWGLADVARHRHVAVCRLIRDTRVHSSCHGGQGVHRLSLAASSGAVRLETRGFAVCVLMTVAGNICQALPAVSAAEMASPCAALVASRSGLT